MPLTVYAFVAIGSSPICRSMIPLEGIGRTTWADGMGSMQPFDDVLASNAEYSKTFADAGTPGRAARGLAVVTCMDSRINPLGMLGLDPGDAKILRNAGAR